MAVKYTFRDLVESAVAETYYSFLRFRRFPLFFKIYVAAYMTWFLFTGGFYMSEIIAFGFMAKSAPRFLNFLWNVFAFLDLAMAVVLLYRPRTGVLIGLACIFVELQINIYYPYPDIAPGFERIFNQVKFLEVLMLIFSLFCLPFVFLWGREISRPEMRSLDDRPEGY
ncbi:MAG: hypothetical protein RMM53_04780 [Bacteroidia bacterium]|nr:hypothetical protein [Bacteroidia bacterium]MDW8333513.1 hypothetical protein [Bacteroidia bacterium]